MWASLPKQSLYTQSIRHALDVEATCWEHDAPQGQRSEIIEIGVCELNLETGKLGRL